MPATPKTTFNLDSWRRIAGAIQNGTSIQVYRPVEEPQSYEHMLKASGLGSMYEPTPLQFISVCGVNSDRIADMMLGLAEQNESLRKENAEMKAVLKQIKAIKIDSEI